MSLVLPRLDRELALQVVERHRGRPLNDVIAAMPDLNVVVTYSAVGGERVMPESLEPLRSAFLELATKHGFPGPPTREAVQRFEAAGARLIRDQLSVAPHEAAHDDVWSYLTCCWLLDIALWRFGPQTIDRFVGHLN